MNFTTKPISIENIVADNLEFLIPVYQRPYVWDDIEIKKLLEDLKISIEEDKNTIEDLKSGVKDLKIEREQLTKDTSKSKEEKKLLYAEITTKQDELRVLKDNIQSQIKYKI